ncbi:ribbon-helix-helix domain-containing protein [Lysinibacillus sphaericus]|nr:ribbon-helix-helix domain-containing protein [Lysinibacillus sphaericus]
MLVKDKAPKSRTAISNTIDNELYKKLKELSIETKMPLNKLLDEAIEYLIKERKS